MWARANCGIHFLPEPRGYKLLHPTASVSTVYTEEAELQCTVISERLNRVLERTGSDRKSVVTRTTRYTRGEHKGISERSAVHNTTQHNATHLEVYLLHQQKSMSGFTPVCQKHLTIECFVHAEMLFCSTRWHRVIIRDPSWYVEPIWPSTRRPSDNYSWLFMFGAPDLLYLQYTRSIALRWLESQWAYWPLY